MYQDWREGPLHSSARTVFVVHRDRLLTDLMATTFSNDPLCMVGTSSSIAEGLGQIETKHPDIVLIDGRLFSADINANTDLIAPPTLIALLADELSPHQFGKAFDANISGLFSKQEGLEPLRRGLLSLDERTTYVCSSLQRSTGSGIENPRSEVPCDRLTEKQLEIVKELVRSGSIKDIGTRVDLTPKAVESQKFRILRRLKLRDRVDLIHWAFRVGLVDPHCFAET